MTTVEKITLVVRDYLKKDHDPFCTGLVELIVAALRPTPRSPELAAAEKWLRDETVHTAEGWEAAEKIAAELDRLRIELLRRSDATLNLVAEAALLEQFVLRQATTVGFEAFERTVQVRDAIEAARLFDGATLPETTELSSQLAILRAAGWTVAVHNDYRVSGKGLRPKGLRPEKKTFWLFTHENGQWLKGEGDTDEAAVDQCLVELHNRLRKD